MFVAILLLVSAAPALADRRSDAQAQVEFGITVAQRGLWKEATFRWQKAGEEPSKTQGCKIAA